MPLMMTSNLPASSAGMIPSKAVGTNSTSTPMSSASLRPTSGSNPINSPFNARIDHGVNVDRPILITPCRLMDSITLSAAIDWRTSWASAGAEAPRASPAEISNAARPVLKITLPSRQWRIVFPFATPPKTIQE